MRKRSISSRVLAAAAVASIAAAAYLGTALELRAGAPVEPAPYLPSISDLMISTIQPRHIRLWIAAHEGNWEFGAYELGNLKGAFNRLGHAHPTVEANSLPDMVSAVTGQPFADLTAAVKAKDLAAFDKSYADLTSACNSCHQALNHGAVVIKVPQQAAVSDQDFSPRSP
ncbi:conserved exported hypothetical protein [Bradyrhizobium sp. STM 3843]|uniref:cytochrome family protein n=1 Tax=Bradyrhizobium sp. STM 3843 TaxID=551947 RepID=UPI00024034BC|nr:cytochrome family protein [Bradyrhizobium sp. STM 3843]CCE11983.1 conserved exported hypothetical protein [Bradyrhizobium sp. STM 3843]